MPAPCVGWMRVLKIVAATLVNAAEAAMKCVLLALWQKVKKL